MLIILSCIIWKIWHFLQKFSKVTKYYKPVQRSRQKTTFSNWVSISAWRPIRTDVSPPNFPFCQKKKGLSLNFYHLSILWNIGILHKFLCTDIVMHLIGMSAYAHFSFLQARTKLSQKIFPYYHQHHLSHITTRIPIGLHLTFTFCHLFQISWRRVLVCKSAGGADYCHDWFHISLSRFLHIIFTF